MGRSRYPGRWQAVPALAEFLHDQLGLQAPADPPAQAAVRLETLGDLTDLITTPGLDPLPGEGNEAGHRLLHGVRDGLSSEEAASQMIRHVLRYALKMDI